MNYFLVKHGRTMETKLRENYYVDRLTNQQRSLKCFGASEKSYDHCEDHVSSLPSPHLPPPPPNFPPPDFPPPLPSPPHYHRMGKVTVWRSTQMY